MFGRIEVDPSATCFRTLLFTIWCIFNFKDETEYQRKVAEERRKNKKRLREKRRKEGQKKEGIGMFFIKQVKITIHPWTCLLQVILSTSYWRALLIFLVPKRVESMDFRHGWHDEGVPGSAGGDRQRVRGSPTRRRSARSLQEHFKRVTNPVVKGTTNSSSQRSNWL